MMEKELVFSALRVNWSTVFYQAPNSLEGLYPPFIWRDIVMSRKKEASAHTTATSQSDDLISVDSNTCTGIKKLREREELTQRQLASRVGVTESTVAGWENGRSVDNIRKVQRLCVVLRCEVDELIEEEEIPYTDDEIFEISQNEELKQSVQLTRSKSLISDLRKDIGMTQRRLAERMGVTISAVANWERGRRGLDWIVHVKRLCEALDCDVDELMEEENESDNTKEAIVAQWHDNPEIILRN